MSRSLLENEERPICDLIWNLDLDMERIPEWFHKFNDFSSTEFVRKGMIKKDKKGGTSKNNQDNTIGFCRSRILVLLAYSIQSKSNWREDVRRILNINSLDNMKDIITDIFKYLCRYKKDFTSHVKIIRSAKNYSQILTSLDRIFHILNEQMPAPLQFIKNSMSLANYIFSNFSSETIVTEFLGLLVEVYLMITTCLPSSSLLFEKSNYGISATQKLLLEVLFFQLFTFPLLSWSDLRVEVTSILNRLPWIDRLCIVELPPKVYSLFATLYFLYENTSFNTNPFNKSLCDRTNQITLKTYLAHRLQVKRAGAEMGVSWDILKAILNRMRSILENPRYPRDQFPMERGFPFDPTIEYVKIPESITTVNDSKLAVLLKRVIAEHLTNPPTIDTDNPRFEPFIRELYVLENRDINILQSYYLWLLDILNYITQEGMTSFNYPLSLAEQLCGPVDAIQEIAFDKSYSVYKRELNHQYQRAYLNNPSYEHTNTIQCNCCHCALSHIHKAGNMNQFYCRFCINRLNTSLKSVSNSFSSINPEAYELSNSFQFLSPEEEAEAAGQKYLDLTESKSSSAFFVRSIQLNTLIPLIDRDKTPEMVMKSVNSETSRLNELNQFISMPDYTDATCCEDWLCLKLVKARSLRLSLVSSIQYTVDRVKKEFQRLCLIVLESLCNFLIEKWNKNWMIQLEQYKAVVRLFYDFSASRNDPIKNLCAQDMLLANIDLILDFCFSLVYPYYLRLQQIQPLHDLLLNRNQNVYERIIRERAYDDPILEYLKLFYSLTSSEDIEDMDQFHEDEKYECYLDISELSKVLTVLKRKSILVFYADCCEKYQPSTEAMDYFAGRHQLITEESLGSFIDRQQEQFQTQIRHLGEKVRKYHTNRYLAEYCFSLSVCNIIKSKYLTSSNVRRTDSGKDHRHPRSHRSSIDVPEHHLSSRASIGARLNSHVIKDELNSDTSSLNEDYICEEKIGSISPQSFNGAKVLTKPRSGSAAQTYQVASTPAVSSVQIATPLFNNNVYTICKQLYFPSQQCVQLPASFEYIQSCFENNAIQLLFQKVISSSPESAQINFFISFVILWFLSSPSIRELIRKGKSELDANASTLQQSPMIAPAVNPASLSPSIQSMCTILNFTPQVGSEKTEIDILCELLPEIEGVLDKKELLRISSISLHISESFVKNNLLSNYQQFGLACSFTLQCTEDTIDYLLISLHHRLKRLCSPPTSIVDYMRCSCLLHDSVALHYSFKLHCDCDETPKQMKSTMWISLQGYSYHTVIKHKLEALMNQPSAAAQQVAGELAAQQCFSHFIRQSLLPYNTLCQQCHQECVAEFQFEKQAPQVLFIRISWATSFSMNDKNLTFCGIPEKVNLSDIHPSGKGTYMLRSVLIRNKENGEAIIYRSDIMKKYVLYSLTWTASIDTFEEMNSYCSQLRFQPLLLLYDLVLDSMN